MGVTCGIIQNKAKFTAMTKKQEKKLYKALSLMEQAQKLVNEVSAENESFRYSSNANFRDNRIEAAVSILKTEIEQVTQ
jgi:hypothetical protein